MTFNSDDGRYVIADERSASIAGDSVSNYTLTAASVLTTDQRGEGAVPDVTLQISAVDNSNNSITLAFINFGSVYFQSTLYVLGYADNGILVSSSDPHTIGTDLKFGLNTDGVLNVISSNSIAAGQTLSFSASGIWEMPCFAAGTAIRTPRGAVPVEALRAGDAVCLARGGRRRLRWIGHRMVDATNHPRPWDVSPVRILAGAFAPGQPARDLRLSPDHAVFVDRMLVPVRYLLNGATIVQEPPQSVSYFHLELDAHDVLLAEGLPCESYLDTGNRGAFANGGTLAQMHPDFARGVWAAKACAPLIQGGAALEGTRSWLLRRAGQLGFLTTYDAAPRLIAGHHAIEPDVSGRCYRFRIPAAVPTLRLSSRNAVPAELHAAHADHRRLGIAVSRIVLDGVAVPLTDPRLQSGWHAIERDGVQPDWRWTDGDALLELAGGRVLDVEVGMTTRYWAAWTPGNNRQSRAA